MSQVSQRMGIAACPRHKAQVAVEELQQEETKLQEAKRLQQEQEQAAKRAAAAEAEADAAKARRASDAADAEAINAATAEELRDYLRQCGMGSLAGGAGDDADLRAAVTRLHAAPSWQEAKRLSAQ